MQLPVVQCNVILLPGSHQKSKSSLHDHMRPSIINLLVIIPDKPLSAVECDGSSTMNLHPPATDHLEDLLRGPLQGIDEGGASIYDITQILKTRRAADIEQTLKVSRNGHKKLPLIIANF